MAFTIQPDSEIDLDLVESGPSSIDPDLNVVDLGRVFAATKSEPGARELIETLQARVQALVELKARHPASRAAELRNALVAHEKEQKRAAQVPKETVDSKDTKSG